MKRSSTVNWRLVAAGIVAPVAGVAVAAMAALPAICGDEISCAPDSLGFAAVFGAWFGLMLGWPAMLALGLPAHAVLLRKRLTSALAYMAAGALIGTVVSLAYFALHSTGLSVVLGCGAGIATAAAFWIIRRPDRAPSNPPTPRP